mgnify:CR=1 FL=1
MSVIGSVYSLNEGKLFGKIDGSHSKPVVFLQFYRRSTSEIEIKY